MRRMRELRRAHKLRSKRQFRSKYKPRGLRRKQKFVIEVTSQCCLFTLRNFIPISSDISMIFFIFFLCLDGNAFIERIFSSKRNPPASA